MYIKYTFVHFAILLIHQIVGVVPLPVTSPFAVETLSLRLRTRLGLLHLSSNLLAILLEVPLLPFALLSKLVVLSTINTWCFSWFLPSLISASRRAWNRFRYPLHIIVHHEVLLTWWWWLENSVNHYLIWKINSHLIQAIVVPRQSEHMLTSWAILLHLLAIELVGDFISLNSGICLKY